MCISVQPSRRGFPAWRPVSGSLQQRAASPAVAGGYQRALWWMGEGQTRPAGALHNGGWWRAGRLASCRLYPFCSLLRLLLS